MVVHFMGQDNVMKMLAMLTDVWRALFSPPATETEREAADPSENVRGMLRWNGENCTGCDLCAKDCPAKAIQLVVIDKKAKRFAMCYDCGRCTYCGQCAESCRFDCWTFTEAGVSSAATRPGEFEIYFGEDEDHVLAEASEERATEGR
jgi:formate hydrogenlyase subunit 6/NADH:ubiquinone oxidoreductase subunit I